MTSARLARWISGRVNSGLAQIILLGVEADADAGAGPAAAALALIAGRPRDPADRQADGLGPGVIGRNPRQAGVDDIADAGHRDRGLGDIGGDDDLALPERLEDAFLVGRLQSAEDRQDHRLPELFGQQGAAEADILFGRQKGEDIAWPLMPVEIGDGPHRMFDIAVLHLQLVFFHRQVMDGHRIVPAGDPHHRGVAEVPGEGLGVDGRRGDDDPQIGAGRQQLFDVAEEKIDVEAALVGLVDNDRAVAAQQGVGAGLGQEDAVGHELDPGLAWSSRHGSGSCGRRGGRVRRVPR